MKIRKPEVSFCIISEVTAQESAGCFRITDSTVISHKPLGMPNPTLEAHKCRLTSKFLVQEVGWDSSKPGYDGLVDVAKRLLVQYRTGEETERATVQHMLTL